MTHTLLSQNLTNPILDQSIQGFSGVQFFNALAKSGMSIILAVGIVSFMLYFLYGGVLWISSGGDQTKLQKARQTLINALLGLLILTSTWAIARFIEVTFGISIININLSSIAVGAP